MVSQTTRPVSFSHIESTISKDGQTASLNFMYAGKRWHYNLSASTIYADEATVMEHTSHGPQRLPIPATRTFVSRIGSRRASARINEDGSVIGLFQVDNKFVQLKPSDDDDKTAKSQQHAGKAISGALFETSVARGTL